MSSPGVEAVVPSHGFCRAPGHAPNPRFDDANFRLRFARLATHYRRHTAFFADEQLLRNAPILNGILGILVNGRYGVRSPPSKQPDSSRKAKARFVYARSTIQAAAANSWKPLPARFYYDRLHATSHKANVIRPPLRV